MNLALIGMSGIGKSYWAKQLAQAGWARYDCDAMIAERLGELIEVNEDEDAVIAVGRWMGMPWTKGYEQREQQYLDLETQVTAEALDAMENLPTDQPAVLDTTGSVIYTGDPLLSRIKQRCEVVYLQAPESIREEMVKLYCDEPKPVLWRGGFDDAAGKTSDETLAASYAQLLASRSEQYAKLADRLLEYNALRQCVNISQFVEML